MMRVEEGNPRNKATVSGSLKPLSNLPRKAVAVRNTIVVNNKCRWRRYAMQHMLCSC